MCGIVGLIGNLNQKHKEAFSTLLMLNQKRGRDSTGIIALGEFNDEYYVAKALGTPNESKGLFDVCDRFQGRRGTKLPYYNRPSKALIGHNRAATQGKVTSANAHPFDFEKIVGVHNGTLDTWECEIDKVWGADKFEVDSEALFYNINKRGIYETIPKTCGAWALVWLNKEEKTINFLRNDQRPLWYVYTEDEEVMIFASEIWMIEAACSAHDIKLKRFEKDNKVYFYSFKKDILHQIDVSKNFTRVNKPSLVIWDEKGQELVGKPEVSYQKRYANSYNQYGVSYNYNKNQSSLSAKNKGGEDKKDNFRSPNKSNRKNNESETASIYKDICENRSGYVDLILPSNFVETKKFITMQEMDIGLPIKIFYRYKADPMLKQIKESLITDKSFRARICSYDQDYLHAQINSVQGPFNFNVTPNFLLEDHRNNVENLYVTGPKGRQISRKDFEDLVLDGCSICQANDVDFSEHAEVQWIEDGVFICPKCVKEWREAENCYGFAN